MAKIVKLLDNKYILIAEILIDIWHNDSIHGTVFIGRPVRATITLYPIGRPVRANITLYPIGRPVRRSHQINHTHHL